MATKTTEEAPAAEAPAEPKPAGPPKGPMIIALINTLAILGTFGFFYYTRKVFKRPAITETSERKKVEVAMAKPFDKTAAILVSFEPMTVNIAPNQTETKTKTEGTEDGTMHYVNIGFSIELQDPAQKENLETLRPMIIDQVMSIIGHKNYDDLVTVQGRYHLRTEIVDVSNQLLARVAGVRASAVSNVYLSQFMVQ